MFERESDADMQAYREILRDGIRNCSVFIFRHTCSFCGNDGFFPIDYFKSRDSVSDDDLCDCLKARNVVKFNNLPKGSDLSSAREKWKVFCDTALAG